MRGWPTETQHILHTTLLSQRVRRTPSSMESRTARHEAGVCLCWKTMGKKRNATRRPTPLPHLDTSLTTITQHTYRHLEMHLHSPVPVLFHAPESSPVLSVAPLGCASSITVRHPTQNANTVQSTYSDVVLGSTTAHRLCTHRRSCVTWPWPKTRCRLKNLPAPRLSSSSLERP